MKTLTKKELIENLRSAWEINSNQSPSLQQLCKTLEYVMRFHTGDFDKKLKDLTLAGQRSALMGIWKTDYCLALLRKKDYTLPKIICLDPTSLLAKIEKEQNKIEKEIEKEKTKSKTKSKTTSKSKTKVKVVEVEENDAEAEEYAEFLAFKKMRAKNKK